MNNKTDFTAEEFCRTPAIVYRKADLGERVKIIHDRYPDKEFYLVAVDKEMKKDG